jgi:MarR family transcriptional regulator, lower aerobic nicotinate degradation pathway regulator
MRDRISEPTPIKETGNRRTQGGPGQPRPHGDNELASFALEKQVGFLLRAASQRNTVLFKNEMVHGLTRVQFAAMAKLFEIGSCAQNELGRLILLDRATIKGVVSRLRGRGFIKIVPHECDRRQHVLSLTKLGHKVVQRAIAIAPSITEKMLEPLNAIERKQIIELLRKICNESQNSG